MTNLLDLFRHKPSERGQAIVMVVFALVGIVSLVGLALDAGSAFSDRRQAQNAADSAALAAAMAYIGGQDMNAAALHLAKTNGYANDGDRSKIVIEHPPAQGPYSCASRPADCQNFILVRITSNVKTWFSSVVGVKTITNTVYSTVRAKKKVNEPMYNGAALVALSKTNCKSFYLTGSSTTRITGSGVFVNSSCKNSDVTNPQQAFYSSGNGHVSARWIKVVGGAHYRGGDFSLEQPIMTGVVPYPDIRDLYNLPDIVCGEKGAVDPTNSTIAWPGSYDSFPPSGVKEMMPGKYCVGNLKIKSDLVGEDVLIVTTGAVKMNANVYISLKAKTQGEYAGLLIYMAPAHQQPVEIEGNSALELTGTILAPSADITISGTGKAERSSFNSQIIGNTITIQGTTEMQINYLETDNYHPTTPPEVEIVK